MNKKGLLQCKTSPAKPVYSASDSFSRLNTAVTRSRAIDAVWAPEFFVVRRRKFSDGLMKKDESNCRVR